MQAPAPAASDPARAHVHDCSGRTLPSVDLRQPFGSLLVLGGLATIGVSVLHLLWPWLGLRADLGGLRGAVKLGILSLLFVLPMVVVGVAIGAYISPKQV